MNIGLVDFYFQMVLAVVVIVVIIYFTFILKIPENENNAGIISILCVLREQVAKFMIFLLVLYSIVAFLGLFINSVRDIPYIINKNPQTAMVEIITGNPTKTKPGNFYVKNLSSGEILNIKTKQRFVNVGEIYHIEYIPNTGWSRLEPVNNSIE